MSGSKRYNRNYNGPWRKTPGRIIGLGLIRCYQLTLSSLIGNQCRHLPTCSEYTYEAIARFGLWAGAFMGLFRVMRCGPLGTHGIDPVPVVLPGDYRYYKPWSLWKISKKNKNDKTCCHNHKK